MGSYFNIWNSVVISPLSKGVWGRNETCPKIRTYPTNRKEHGGKCSAHLGALLSRWTSHNSQESSVKTPSSHHGDVHMLVCSAEAAECIGSWPRSREGNGAREREAEGKTDLPASGPYVNYNTKRTTFTYLAPTGETLLSKSAYLLSKQECCQSKGGSKSPVVKWRW